MSVQSACERLDLGVLVPALGGGERGVKRDLKRGIRNTDECINSSNVPMVSPVTT